MKRYINSVKNIVDWRFFWKEYYQAKGSDASGSFSVKLRGGLTAEVPYPLISAFDEVFLREVYGESINNSTPTPTVLDIGANVGYFSLLVFLRYPQAKVFAFEPLPGNYKLLEKHQQTNSLSNLVVDRRAVYGTQKSVQLNYREEVAYSVGASVVDRASADTMIEVEAASIPDIFTDYSLPDCDLLKVDCEGAEYNILFNCPPEYYQKIKNIAIEVHEWVPKSEGTVATLVAFLQKRGYAVTTKKNGIVWGRRVS